MARSAAAKRTAQFQQRRLEAARLFGKGASQAEVARQLKVSRVSAMRWYRIWRGGGRAALAQVAPLGRPARLSPAQLRKVEKRLLRGAQAEGYSTDLWTLPRVAEVISRVTGVKYHPGHVWRVLRGLGWSLQRPAKQARERDEEAIERWKKRVWPRVKKTSDPTAPLFSWTNRASPRGRWSAGRGRPAGRLRC